MCVYAYLRSSFGTRLAIIITIDKTKTTKAIMIAVATSSNVHKKPLVSKTTMRVTSKVSKVIKAEINDKQHIVSRYGEYESLAFKSKKIETINLMITKAAKPKIAQVNLV